MHLPAPSALVATVLQGPFTDLMAIGMGRNQTRFTRASNLALAICGTAIWIGYHAEVEDEQLHSYGWSFTSNVHPPLLRDSSLRTISGNIRETHKSLCGHCQISLQTKKGHQQHGSLKSQESRDHQHPGQQWAGTKSWAKQAGQNITKPNTALIKTQNKLKKRQITKSKAQIKSKCTMWWPRSIRTPVCSTGCTCLCKSPGLWHFRTYGSLGARLNPWVN